MTAAADFPLDNGFGQFEKENYCLKTGRSTETTAGVSNSTLSTCNWPLEDRRRYDSQGHEVFMTVDHTEEHAIFHNRPHYPEHLQEEFCAAGDSGSVVINSKGQVCGLLYGAVSGLVGPTGQENQTYVAAGLAMNINGCG